jgi:hypothetical protein
LREVVRDTFANENMTGVAAIHHSLRAFDPGCGNLFPLVRIRDVMHRTAVNTHPHGKFRVLPQRFSDLQRAAGRFLRAVAKDQRHAVAGRQPDELFLRGLAHLRRGQHDLSELVQPLLLFLDQELCVTDDVDEQDMADLEAQIFVGVRHRSVFNYTELC